MNKYKSFIPSQVLNTRTEEWQDIEEVCRRENVFNLEGFVKIIPIVDNIHLIIWDGDDCTAINTLYKGILE